MALGRPSGLPQEAAEPLEGADDVVVRGLLGEGVASSVRLDHAQLMPVNAIERGRVFEADPSALAAYFFLNWRHGWPGVPLAADGTLYRMATTMTLAAIVATQIGAVRPEYKLKETVAELKRKGVRVIGRVVAFLCSERASYVTGQVLSVNGGML